MKKIKLTILISIASLFISGCFDSGVNLVKDSVMEFDKTLTIGEALDNWEACEKTDWKQFETGNGKQIVEYTCQEATENYNMKNLEFVKANTAGIIERYIKDNPDKTKYITGLDISNIKQYTTTEMLEYLYMFNKITETETEAYNSAIESLIIYTKIDKIQDKLFSFKNRGVVIQFTINKDDTYQIDNIHYAIKWTDNNKVVKWSTYNNKELTHEAILKQIFSNIKFQNTTAFEMKPFDTAWILYNDYTQALSDTDKNALQSNTDKMLENIETSVLEKYKQYQKKYDMSVKDDTKKEMVLNIYIQRAEYGEMDSDVAQGIIDTLHQFKGYSEAERKELYDLIYVKKLPELTAKDVDFGSIKKNLKWYSSHKKYFQYSTKKEKKLINKIMKLMKLDEHFQKVKKNKKVDEITAFKLILHMHRIDGEKIIAPEFQWLAEELVGIEANKEIENKLFDILNGESKLPELTENDVYFHDEKIKQTCIERLDSIAKTKKQKKLLKEIKNLMGIL